MTKMPQFKLNFLKAYQDIHGWGEGVPPVNGGEQHMCFHGTQRPWEFFRAWEIIEENIPDTKELAFLEVGAAKGVWAIAFMEFCKLYNKDPVYVQITWTAVAADHERAWNDTLVNVENHYNNQCKLWVNIDANSQISETRDLVANIRPMYDMVLIDADHSYAGVKADTDLYWPLAQHLCLWHDIQYRDTVYQAIHDCGIVLNHEIRAHGSGEGIGIELKKLSGQVAPYEHRPSND